MRGANYSQRLVNQIIKISQSACEFISQKSKSTAEFAIKLFSQIVYDPVN